ncbi:MAG: protein jag [Spirochaetales bacterium]|uniref:RNA-binding protein KhpB n=1 Tax=Candidatus Thalassospirochaeta sargassi TaxID=3119039 RepID=A0AAJ1IEX7_9SPIO|nr:protein jag [Spirochaetales bacterium]
MFKEFEGKTEKEAIDKAVEELGIDREEFDVEIVNKQSGIFRKGNVKIKVYIGESEDDNGAVDDFEKKIVEYLETLIEKMGFPGKGKIAFREENKIGIEIESENTGILIGRKGKNLDAIQLIMNVYAGRLGSDSRVIIDAENYRERREENLVRMARKSAEQVRRTQGSRLLEPMNPFERRLVHTTLNELTDIDTISEGDGLYKQIRVLYRGDVR